FAAPHVSGIAARLLQQMGPTAITSSDPAVTTMADVLQTFTCQSTYGIVKGVGISGTPNQLAYLPPAGATVTKAGSTCVNATCAFCGLGQCM
ncbi:MAG: hypothetical protein P4L40_05120, partial [Terracidiphilus sp.]|nr:hypothetical protein [Terracidiphilus sp.]